MVHGLRQGIHFLSLSSPLNSNLPDAKIAHFSGEEGNACLKIEWIG